MTSSRRLLIFGLVAFIAALAGVIAGRFVVETPRASETELHALLHNELKLTPAQQVKIDRIEAKFGLRRDALELDMRAANIRLAQAIEAENAGEHEACWMNMATRAHNTRFLERVRADLKTLEND